MNAGLPGAGIGGVFYLVLALFMPFLELYKTIRGESSLKRWLIVVRQLMMAGAIFAGMWLMGLFLGVLLASSSTGNTENLNHMIQAGYAVEFAKLNIFHIAPVLMSLLTLSVILIFTHVLVLVFRPAAVH